MKLLQRPFHRGRTLLLAFTTACCLTVVSPACVAQEAAAKAPAYDAVSIRINSSGSTSSSSRIGNNLFSATNVTLKQILQGVHNIRPDLISGIPSSIDSVRFDITAKVSSPDANAPAISEKQLIQMIPSMLADRFHLQTHFDTTLMPVYDLVVLEGGPKLQPARRTARRTAA